MSAISGKDGTVKIGAVEIAEITAWSFNPTSNNPSFASSSVPGYKRRVAGVKDGSGNFDFKLQDATELAKFAVGTEVTLVLDVDGSATATYTVPSFIDSVTVETDMDDGEVVGGSCDFSTNGAWTEPS